MHIANIHETKTHLSQLLERVAQGEEIWIAKAGKPVARIVGLETEKKPREAGAARGRIHISGDLEETSDDIIASFEESEIFPCIS